MVGVPGGSGRGMREACPGAGAPDARALGRRDPATGQVIGIRVLESESIGKPRVAARFPQEAREVTSRVWPDAKAGR